MRQLEAHVTQLRNLVIKADGSKVEGQGRRKPQREFDFNKYVAGAVLALHVEDP